MSPRSQPDILWGDTLSEEIDRENARVHKRRLTAREARRQRLYPLLWTLGGFAFLALCMWGGGWYS